MNKKQVKIVAIIIAVLFLLGIAGPLAYIAFSEPDSSGLSDIDEMSDADINAKIKELGDQITAAEKESAELDKKAEAADELDKKQTEESGRRFRIMCERGISSYLDIIFSSTDLSDFNDRIVIAKELAEYDKKVASALKDVKREIADAKEEKLRLSEQLKSSKEELECLSAARQAERHRAESNDRQVSQNNADSSDDE
ncbi:MAG: hypothetical protein Q4G53_05700 [Clostridia bacterium]|nr:hypothetical protein [Clostridia bacterium]